MFRNHPENINSFRFRRWSRAGYAIFRSLSCNVTIGKVCSSICEMSFRKSGMLAHDLHEQYLNNAYVADDDGSPGSDPYFSVLFVLEQLLGAVILTKKAVVPAVVVRILFYIICKPAVGIRSSYTNRFFYVTL